MEADLVEQLGSVADLMLAELGQTGDEMDAAVLKDAPVLGADASIAAEVSASNRANLRRLLTALARRDGRPPPADAPVEALDVARTVVRRGLDLDMLFQAYRQAQNVAWRRWMGCAARVAPGPGLVPLLEASSTLLFDYVDRALALVLAEAQREREEVLGGALARRAEVIRLILDGAPLDRARASERLGYELSRGHTGLVLWADAPGDAQGDLESAATLLASAAGARRPLLLPAGTTTLWAWIGTDADIVPDDLREAFAAAGPGVRAAVGQTRGGVTGFRRTHADALDVQRLLAEHPGGERLALHRDLAITALVAQDPDRARAFVLTSLGALAADDARSARLRDTLRIYLGEADNAPRAAARLHTHRNTVLQRVARAADLLGHPVGDRRLELQLALELAHQLGRRVLATGPRPAPPA